MGESEKQFLIEAFDSNWIAPLGPNVDAFEKEMSEYLNYGFAAALSTGTAAIHLALRLSNVKKGDYVICPSLTFAASANPIIYEQAVPVFIDVNKETWTLEPNLLENAFKKYKPKALISVDLYGQSADYDNILFLCKKYNVKVIEDSAEALGASYKEKKCGVFGDFGVFSFNGNKIITTGGGGMLISGDEKMIKKARFLATQSREPVIHYEHKELGFNYRMSNLLASLGRGQLRVLDDRVKSRREIANYYYKNFKEVEGIDLVAESNYGKSSRWLSVVLIDSKSFGSEIIEIIDRLDRNNVEARPVWKPMHMQPFYKDCIYITKDNIDVSQSLFKQGLRLPSGSSLTKNQLDYIVGIVLDNHKG